MQDSSQNDENQNVEWKQVWRDEYLKWVAGFANADGGTLVIGKNDQGQVVGISNAQKLLEDIPNKVRDILGIIVDVNLHEVDNQKFLEIVIESYPYPISYKGQYHYRSGSTIQELKGAALDRFLLRKQGKRWDGVPVPYFNAEECSQAAFQLFREKAAKSGRMDTEIQNDSDAYLLENLQLTEGSYLKRAAALLFYDKPEKFVTGAYIKIGFFMTDDDLRYQDEIHGNLFEQVEKALDLLYFKYLKAYIHYEDIYRIERYLFPKAALREALLNAVVHKDYSDGVPIQLSVYEDRIVLWNRGELPDNWTLEYLQAKHPSKPYNPLIANAFFRTGYIEAWGRGIEKINHACLEHGIAPPIYDYRMSGLMLTFHANSQDLIDALGKNGTQYTLKSRVEARDNATLHQETILALLQKFPQMSARLLAKHIGISSRKIEQNIVKLKTEGILRRVGPPRGGHWELIG